MEYKLVELQEKRVVGLSVRTSNGNETMSKVIGDTWQRFFSEGIYQKILNKKNQCTIGLYSNYENDAVGEYDVTVCCEVNKCELIPEETEVKIITSGKYAQFIVRGHMQNAVADFWTKLSLMNLNRKYDFDFEEYQSGGDMENGEIYIYISVN